MLAALAAASVARRSLLGRAPHARVTRIGSDPGAYTEKPDAPWHARHGSFDLHAGRTVGADDRVGVERLCHYLLRPPLAQERIEILPDGRVGVTLARPWADGTRALVFTGIEFLEKLAVLIPKPRINLVVYHGMLAPGARHRAAVLRAIPSPPPPEAPPASIPHTQAAIVTAGAAHPPPSPTVRAAAAGTADAAPPPSDAPRRGGRPRYFTWAELLRRIFEIDVLACTCGGRLRFIATIQDPPVVERILSHLGIPTAVPHPAPARPPPCAADPAFDFPG